MLLRKVLGFSTWCCVLFFGCSGVSSQISSKMDFGEGTVDSQQKGGEENVEVQQTITVSTKLNNNHPRAGFRQNNRPADASSLTYSIGANGKPIREVDLDVPVVKGYKAVETTPIHPSTRPPPRRPDSYFISRNIRNDYDVYPPMALNGLWKPATFFHNINWYGDIPADGNWLRDPPKNNREVKLQRKITDDGMKEFDCKRCRELSLGSRNGCGVYIPAINVVHSTTKPKVKIDGKIAKLD